MECRKLSLTEEINTLAELRECLKNEGVAGERARSCNLYVEVNYLGQVIVFLYADSVGKWTLNGKPEYNEDSTDNYEPTEETFREIGDILESFASRYAVNIRYSVDHGKTIFFYIPEEYLEEESESYVIQVRDKANWWQNYKAFESNLMAKSTILMAKGLYKNRSSESENLGLMPEIAYRETMVTKFERRLPHT